MVRAHWNGAVIAASDDTVIIDGNHDFSADSVDEHYLVPSTKTTVCPWKGTASFYSIYVDGQLNRDAAWYYPTPSSAAKKIQGRVAFWHGVKIEDDATVASTVVDLDDATFFTALERKSPSSTSGRRGAAPASSSIRCSTHERPTTPLERCSSCG
jgi:uncharacterized protein (DUF427 family)